MNVIPLFWKDSPLEILEYLGGCHSWVDRVIGGRKILLFSAGIDIPELHCLIAARGDESRAIWRKRHVTNFVGVTFETYPERTGIDIPQMHRVIPSAAGREFSAIW